MSKYVRVMHPAEADEIGKHGAIPTNREDWGEHRAGTVVFLFDGDRVSWAYLRSRAEDVVEECGEAVILSFEGRLAEGVDKSGWDKGGAVVHAGPVVLTEQCKVRWARYRKNLG
jgi:hypothetical protein